MNGKSKGNWMTATNSDGRGMSPSTQHNQSLMLKKLEKISSPIVDYNNHNMMLLDRSEIRKNLLDGY